MNRLSHRYLKDLEAQREPGYYDRVLKLAIKQDKVFAYFEPDIFQAIKRNLPLPDKPGKLRQGLNILRASAHAAKSMTKTTLGIDVATDEQFEARLKVCRQCPGGHAVYKDGKLHTCGPMVESMKQAGKGTCGCVLSRKAKDLKEDCPFGWWPKPSA